MNIEEIIKKMTLEDKVAFCSGESFWETKKFEKYGIPSIFMCDGPHGLRKQDDKVDHLGLNASIKTTCFPTASALSSTWDLELVEEIGEALGKEAIKVGSNMILGPGTNMKRNPLCGRNFEYFSEDPFLSGKLSSAWIKGVQRTGTGVSLKHYAMNNQELKRMNTNVLVDERAMREYYLPAFEIAVKEANPTTIMCAYNKVEGEHCSDNKHLINDILREEWAFKGAVVTDWAAMNDRISAFKAGVDLEMPGSKGRFDKEVLQAVHDGILDEKDIDTCVKRILQLIERTTKRKTIVNDDIFNDNHKLARRVAANAGVLLKNEDNILPLSVKSRIAVIGKLAEKPRYQGAGSSQVTPTNLISLIEGIKEYTDKVEFEEGYTIIDDFDDILKDKAVICAGKADIVVVCLGLTDVYESEGFDREHMRIPANQIRLLQEISKVNNKIVVVLVGGSAIEMTWEKQVSSILHMQLTGQASGSAAADLLFGKISPSGKLTESYPYRYEDVINSSYFDINPIQAPYLESMYCGYRYYTSAKVPVRYPFGYGLSYTTFEYSDMKINKLPDNEYEITVTIKNAGKYDGAEIVQLYVAPQFVGAYRPVKELKGFVKVYLKKGEEKQVSIILNKRSFAIYGIQEKEWIIEEGLYEMEIGASIVDIRVKDSISMDGYKAIKSNCSKWYYTLKGVPTNQDFLSIHQEYQVEVPKRKGAYDMSCSIKEMKNTSLLCKLMYKVMERTIAKQCGVKVDYSNPSFKMMMDIASDNPMRTMPLFSPDSMPLKVASFFVDWANGHPLKALKGILTK